VCSFDSNDCVMLFSENKYDDDDGRRRSTLELVKLRSLGLEGGTAKHCRGIVSLLFVRKRH